MSRPSHPRKRTPPRRLCRDCGGQVYAWAEAPLCKACARAVPTNAERKRPEHESLRDYRKRVIDGERNA